MQMATFFFNFGPSREGISLLTERHRYSPLMRRAFLKFSLRADFAPNEIRNARNPYGARRYPLI